MKNCTLVGDETDWPKRKKIRLEGYDYASCGAYFVTIRICDPNAALWDVARADIIRPGETPLSLYGEIVDATINAIPQHYDAVAVDKYCIMPDHVHMILRMLPDGGGDGRTADGGGRIISAPTVSVVIGSMKRWVSKQIGFPVWQKSFNDRIIRNEQEYRAIWQYIDENPMKWQRTP